MSTNPLDQSRKIFFFYIVIAILFFIVVSRIFYLQVITFSDRQETAENIRARVIPSLAPRGIIFDRKGVVLATSRPYFSLYLLCDK